MVMIYCVVLMLASIYLPSLSITELVVVQVDDLLLQST